MKTKKVTLVCMISKKVIHINFLNDDEMFEYIQNWNELPLGPAIFKEICAIKLKSNHRWKVCFQNLMGSKKETIHEIIVSSKKDAIFVANKIKDTIVAKNINISKIY